MHLYCLLILGLSAIPPPLLRICMLYGKTHNYTQSSL
uniref:Uncharacterized protein n=1 Tax=Anguilla anguilla TaxID=7936 RepID=A0A0E9UX01_ANGAN